MPLRFYSLIIFLLKLTSARIAHFLLLFFVFKFRESVEPDLFSGTLERSRTARASSKKLTPRLDRRAAPADLRGGERAARNPIGSLSADLFTPPCGDLSMRAHTRPRPPPRCFVVLRFFGAHSASALRRRRTSWFSPGSRLLANSDLVAMGRGILTLAQRGRSSAQGHKGGDTSSHARCHQDMANAWRASRARKIKRDRVKIRT